MRNNRKANAQLPSDRWENELLDETKKLKGALEAVQALNGTWVGVNTSNPNKIVNEAIQLGLQNGKSHFKHWSEYGFYKSEFKISKETRLDGARAQGRIDFYYSA